MVGIENRPHTKRMALLRTTTSRALFQFALSHCVAFFGSSEWLESAALIATMLELVEAASKLSTDAVCFASILTDQTLTEVTRKR